MTGTTDKLRSLFLATLMVTSVVAVGVSFTGAAAAQAANDAVEVTDSVEYADGEVELVFNQSVDSDSVSVNEVYVDGETGIVSADSATASGQQAVVSLSDDVTPNRNLTIDLTVERNGEPNDVVVEDVETTATAIAEDTTSESRGDATIVYQGEPIAIVASETQEDIQIRGNGINIETDTGANSQVYTYDSDRLDTGETYRVNFNGDSSDREFFNVTSLGLSISTDTSITDDDNLTVDATANRDGPAVARLLDSSGDVEQTIAGNLRGGKDVEFDFGTVDDAGNYTVEVTDNNTGATVETDTIEVNEVEGTVGFANNGFVTEEVGDVARIPVEFSNTEEATVVIGSNDQNYYAVAEVTDDDGDGQATLLFNSYVAGSNDANGNLFSVADSDDDVDYVDEGGQFVEDNSDETPNQNLLAAADYDMNVTVGHDVDLSGDDPDEVGGLSLEDRSTEQVSIWTAPQSNSYSGLEAADVHARLNENLTQTNEVAHQDIAVHAVEASGVEGVLDYYGDDATQAFFAENQDDLVLWLNESDPGPNADPDSLLLNDSNTAVVDDATNDTYFFAVETGNAAFNDSDNTSLSDGDALDVNFMVAAGSELTGEDPETIENSYEIVDRTASLNDGEPISVRAQSGQQISGETSVAPGTDVTVRVRSTDTDNPFQLTPETTVTENGTYTVNADFSDVNPGTNFTAVARIPGVDNPEVDGQVGEAAGANVTFSDQESDGSSVAIDSADLGDGGFIAIHADNASGDIVGTSDYLEAGSQEDVEITLDEELNESATLVAMVHMDTNGNEEFDYNGSDTDAPYTQDGEPVTESAEITVGDAGDNGTETPTTDTPTPTETETPTPTETETPGDGGTETPTEGEGPGFTGVVALVALVAAALLAVRRDS